MLIAQRVPHAGWIAGALLAAALAGPALAREASPHERSISGAWDMARQDQARACRLTLRDSAAEPAPHLALAVPAGCRRALPVLGGVAGWESSAPDRIMLAASGGPLLDFRSGSNGAFLAQGPAGETYSLTPGQEHIRAALAAPVKAEPVQERAPGFQSLRSRQGFDQPAVPAPAPIVEAQNRRAQPQAEAAAPVQVSPGEVPGRYSFLREEGRDTGCLVTLSANKRAQLAPACRDQGILIFDPVAWNFERGHLLLTARRGHKVRFTPQVNGTWEKQPPAPPALSLRKI